MAHKFQPGVIGCAVRPAIAGERRSLEELIYDAGRDALADAGPTVEDVDGIVVACNDQLDGRATSIMMASGPLGGVERDILSTPSCSARCGSPAASSGRNPSWLGARRRRRRSRRRSAWRRTRTSTAACRFDELSSHALQARALEAQIAGSREVAEAVAVAVAERNRHNGRLAYPDAPVRPTPGPARWPLTPGMTAAPVTGIVALVLATPDFIAWRGESSRTRRCPSPRASA